MDTMMKLIDGSNLIYGRIALLSKIFSTYLQLAHNLYLETAQNKIGRKL